MDPQAVNHQVKTETVQALHAQQQRFDQRWLFTNNTVKNGLQQFMALQQHALKFNQSMQTREFLDACVPDTVPLQNKTFAMDKFVDGSLSYAPKLLARQMLQRSVQQFEAKDCPEKQQVVAFAHYWVAKRVKTSKVSDYPDMIAELRELQEGTWQYQVAVYSTCLTPHSFMNAQLQEPLDSRTIVGCLAADIERLKQKL